MHTFDHSSIFYWIEHARKTITYIVEIKLRHLKRYWYLSGWTNEVNCIRLEDTTESEDTKCWSWWERMPYYWAPCITGFISWAECLLCHGTQIYYKTRNHKSDLRPYSVHVIGHTLLFWGRKAICTISSYDKKLDVHKSDSVQYVLWLSLRRAICLHPWNLLKHAQKCFCPLYSVSIRNVLYVCKLHRNDSLHMWSHTKCI